MIGIELSDAGILAAVGDPPRLVPVDGEALESPGFAMADGGGWVTGQRAAAVSRRFPHRVDSRFWQRMGRQVPAGSGGASGSAAAAHLAAVLGRIGRPAAAIAVAVPSDFSRGQSGEMEALVSRLGRRLAGAAAMVSACGPAEGVGEGPVLHLDIGLHSTVGAVVRASDGRPLPAGAPPAIGQGIVALHGAWARVVADAFVHATRFDPFHHAADEQALHDRLPSLFEDLRDRDRADFEVVSGGRRMAVTITSRMLAGAVVPYVERLNERVGRWRKDAAPSGPLPGLRVSHRLARLPGVVPALEGAFGTRVDILPPGAAALGVLSRFSADRPEAADSTVGAGVRSPTHLLYRDLAYPLTDTPLAVGRMPGGGKGAVRLRGDPSGVSRTHCVLRRVGSRVEVADASRWGTFLDGRRIEGRARLEAGQTLRLGTPGEELRLIVVLEAHETPDG